MTIELKPLTISWSEWRAMRYTLPRPINMDPHSIVRDISAWQVRVDTWIQSLTDQQKQDLLDLAQAEIDMLYWVVDGAKYAPYDYENERLDFRTRYYDLQPLIATCARLHVANTAPVKEALYDLENYAITRLEWLP